MEVEEGQASQHVAFRGSSNSLLDVIEYETEGRLNRPAQTHLRPGDNATMSKNKAMRVALERAEIRKGEQEEKGFQL